MLASAAASRCAGFAIQVEHELGGLGLEGHVADLVDHDQRDAAEATQLRLSAAQALRVQEAGHPVRRGGEGHAVPRQARPDRKGDRQVRLAGPRRPQQHDVAALHARRGDPRPGRSEVTEIEPI